jgi:chromosome segregation ATPase
MGSKVLKQKLYEYEATLKHRDNQIKELQNILTRKDAELRQLLELTKQNEKETEELRRSLSDHPKERPAELYKEDNERGIQGREEEIESLHFAINEKQKEIESLNSAIECKEQEWEFKINEQAAQVNGMMAEKDARIKKLEELLRESEIELERHTTKDNHLKKQLEMKEKSLKIARFTARDKEKEIETLRKRLESREQEHRFTIDELKIEMSSLLTEKDDLIKKLEASLKVKEGELERKYGEETESKKQIQVKDDDLATIRSAMNKKEQEVLELTKTLENKEQELRRCRNDMPTSIHAMERRAIANKGHCFWEALKAFLRVNRIQHH